MKTVMITGTTSGMGREFANKFAKEGYSLILVSKSEERLKSQKEELESTYKVNVKYIAYDLSTSGAAKYIYNLLKAWNIDIDVLINNAGFNECGYFKDTEFKKEYAMLGLHITFTTELIKYVLPDMLSRNEGRIANIGSTGSYIPSPYNAVYSASKAYILSFSNALFGELSDTNVKITTVCPGATMTAFASKAKIENSRLFKIAVMTPQDVVKIAYPKIMKGKRVVVTGIYNKMLVIFSKIMPVNIINKITLFMME